MTMKKILVTDHGFPNVDAERRCAEQAGYTLEVAQCKTAEDVIRAAKDAEALLVQWAPITADVIGSLEKCRVIVRYGIGVDNVDLKAAKARGIAVCNVPDYGVDEVADHAVSLALALGRQLIQIDRRTREGVWKISPSAPMPAYSAMTYAVLGMGRIGRAVLKRASGFGFKLAAHDQFAKPADFAQAGATSLSLDELFREADILSLHAPFNESTRHIVSRERLAQMKKGAVIVNTARGGLIDTAALAQALDEGKLGGAGLDVYEVEPLPNDHPIRKCPNTILTSHVAWYSESSIPKLQKLAGEEAVRGVLGQPLRSPV